METRFLSLYILFALFAQLSYAQPINLNLELEEATFSNAPALQSFVNTSHNGKWLLMGGRTEGLHDHRPPFAFLPANANDQVYVVDPETQEVWSASILTLPVAISEQLLATNIEFTQNDSSLILIGGYGYSIQQGGFVTHPALTVVDKVGLMNAVINAQSITPYFRQLVDNRMAVTGGYLGMIDSVFYLLGGQRFEGMYNPHGPNHGPGFMQAYTNAIRTFQIGDDGINISVQNYTEQVDSSKLHRRDFNALPQIFPNGERGFTLFTGVFQYGNDVPWLDNVDIKSNGYSIDQNFNQLLNQYHSASFSAFEQESNRMHNLFFGGIAMYYFDEQGVLWEDSTVPFVKTISSITRESDGSLSEVAYSLEMPDYLGASASFMFREGLPLIDNDIIDLDGLSGDTTHIGYIYGGIESTSPNIFMLNTGSSNATNRMFKVFVVNPSTDIPEHSKIDEYFNCYPNPVSGIFNIEVRLPSEAYVILKIIDSAGRETELINNEILGSGSYLFKWESEGRPSGIYFCEMIVNGERLIRKFALK